MQRPRNWHRSDTLQLLLFALALLEVVMIFLCIGFFDYYEPYDYSEALQNYGIATAILAAVLYALFALPLWRCWLAAEDNKPNSNGFRKYNSLVYTMSFPLPVALLLVLTGNVWLDRAAAKLEDVVVTGSQSHYHSGHRRAGSYYTYHLISTPLGNPAGRPLDLQVSKAMAEAVVPGITHARFPSHAGALGVRWIDRREIALVNPPVR